MAQISYHFNSSGIYVEVVAGNHTYTKHLDQVPLGERAKLCNSLRDWNRKGAVGFPPL